MGKGSLAVWRLFLLACLCVLVFARPAIAEVEQECLVWYKNKQGIENRYTLKVIFRTGYEIRLRVRGQFYSSKLYATIFFPNGGCVHVDTEVWPGVEEVGRIPQNQTFSGYEVGDSHTFWNIYTGQEALSSTPHPINPNGVALPGCSSGPSVQLQRVWVNYYTDPNGLYHRSDCRRMEKPSQILASQARELHLRPCTMCNPDKI